MFDDFLESNCVSIVLAIYFHPDCDFFDHFNWIFHSESLGESAVLRDDGLVQKMQTQTMLIKTIQNRIDDVDCGKLLNR